MVKQTASPVRIFAPSRATIDAPTLYQSVVNRHAMPRSRRGRDMPKLDLDGKCGHIAGKIGMREAYPRQDTRQCRGEMGEGGRGDGGFGNLRRQYRPAPDSGAARESSTHAVVAAELDQFEPEPPNTSSGIGINVSNVVDAFV